MTAIAILSSLTLALLLAAGVVTVALYNRLVALGRRCDRAEADIDVQLKLRHDLIPNLVETVKGYAGHERGTLEAVIKARQVAIAQPSSVAEAALGGALSRLMAIAESYPELKASANFTELQAEIADTENKIAAARRYSNAAANEYNTSREVFPANLVANNFGFAARGTGVVAKEERASIDAAPAVHF
jgi:LemA protein